MDATEQQLINYFQQLGVAEQATLLAFAEFLSQRTHTAVDVAVTPTAPAPAVIPEPENIERPAGESVVAALKRLSKTYPMLDKSQMLNATSDLVAQHILQGSDAVEAINALEGVFREHYQQLKEGGDSA
ncbi:MAG: Crp/Fnr family transcriptional regulator [Pseudomonadota bacterium]